MDIFNYQDYAEKFLKILTKEGSVSPLKFNTFQQDLWQVIQNKKKENKPVRIIVLKARQLGISTFCTGYLYHQTTTNFHQNAVVIANDRENTNNLFKMGKRYYEFLDDREKPMKRYSNEKALIFENPDEATRQEKPGLLSSIHLETAGKKTVGRSGTIHHLHCSEFAFWDNAGEVVSGLFQAVPYKPETTVIIESTANGSIGAVGEEFYNRWQMAEGGDSGFVPIFFPWWRNPEYEIDPGPGFTLTPYEIELKKKFPITDRKLAFRRYKIEYEMGSSLINPVDQFKQEYPSYPDEAFIHSGRPVFDIEALRDHMGKITDQPIVGEIDGLNFRSDKHGRYKLFKSPEPGQAYAIGADVAEGLEEGDYSTMFVINKNNEQCMSFKGHLDPDLFGMELCKVGQFYNNAVIANEINNHGHATLASIKRADYPNIYSREVKEELSDLYTKKLGWLTNSKTKLHMLDEFVGAYRDGQISIKDKDLLREMMTLFVEPDGNVILNSKDLVVSACIALQALKQAVTGDFDAIVPNKVKKDPKTVQEVLDYYSNKEENGGWYDQ